jgi:hypothetical protein
VHSLHNIFRIFHEGKNKKKKLRLQNFRRQNQ